MSTVCLCGEIGADGAAQNDQKYDKLNFLFFHFAFSVLF